MRVGTRICDLPSGICDVDARMKHVSIWICDVGARICLVRVIIGDLDAG